MALEDWLRIQTNISQAYWCKLQASKKATFEHATLSGEDQRTVSWFDELFYGGITFPEILGRPVTFLLTGSPGVGKSTLAMELCYRLADIEFEQNSCHGGKREPWFCLYLSPDMNAKQVYQKALSLGWKNAANRFYTGFKPLPKEFGNYGLVAVRGAESLQRNVGVAEAILGVLSEGLDLLRICHPIMGTEANVLKELTTKFGRYLWSPDPLKTTIKRISPDIVVIDSLNTIDKSKRERYFGDFLNVSSGRTKIIIFIIDSSEANRTPQIWDYMCDYVIKLYSEAQKKYYLRNIEIVKARFQDHVLGKQQLKIYPKKCVNCANKSKKCSGKPDECNLDAKDKRRAHPYRHEGGIFIYPSIHYYLSKYKRRGPIAEPVYVETKPDSLNTIVKLKKQQVGIFPEGRCTAFVGRRGGHKSHLGYLHLLYRLKEYDESALVISLRDDEEMTRRTLSNILQQEFGEKKPRKKIEDYEVIDRLEILYYPPGYITPEEFYHRMFMSVYRLKEYNRPNAKLTILFNSLDQLSARFPLCAQQDIFIPGIIASLSGEKATSIFIAVDEAGQPEEQYGLIPMADLVLSFKLRRFSMNDYLTNLERFGMKKAKSKRTEEAAQRTKDVVVLQVVRFAGGEMAGAAGILELVTHPQSSVYDRAGLQFVPFGEGFPSGEEIK